MYRSWNRLSRCFSVVIGDVASVMVNELFRLGFGFDRECFMRKMMFFSSA
jgi:hypothetical protein